LDTKITRIGGDPDKKCIITWNDYLGRIKYFMNGFVVIGKIGINIPIKLDNPAFVRIKEKKITSKPYSETELWERQEILYVMLNLTK
jgi:hypothetical protein